MMNTRYLFMIAALAAIILAPSCSSEECEETSAGVEIKLRADIANTAATRAAADIQSSQLAFADGSPELINVEIIDAQVDQAGQPHATPHPPVCGSYIFKTTNTTGSLTPKGTTPYFPKSGNKVNIRAYYPSWVGTTPASTLVLNGENAFAVQTNQSTADAYKQSDLMVGLPQSNPVGATNNAIGLVFTHCLSKIVVRLQLQDGGGLSLTDLQSATVAMNAMSSAPVSDFGEATTQTWNQTTAAHISLGGVTVSSTNAAVYETAAIVVPQTIAASSPQVIAVTLPGTGTCYYSPTMALALQPGRSHVFTFALGMNEIRVVTTINGWVEGNSLDDKVVIDRSNASATVTQPLWIGEDGYNDSQEI